MGVRMRMTPHGVERTVQTIEDLPEEARDAAIEAGKEWQSKTRADARAGAPVRTGRLRKRITTRTDRARLIFKVGVWSDDAFYGYFVENGTSDTPAQPFMFPAYEANRNPVIEATARHIRENLS